MHTPVPESARTPAELRRFGCTVGGVFLFLAAFSSWRGHVNAPVVLGAAGALLVAPGLLVPGVLAPVERGWMRLAMVLGAINTRIILTLVYVLVVTPIGVVRRWRDDPLTRRLGTDARSHWVPRPRKAVDPASYRKQF